MCSCLWATLLHVPIPTFHTSWHLKIRVPHRQNRHRHSVYRTFCPQTSKIYSSLIKPQHPWEAFWMPEASSDAFVFFCNQSQHEMEMKSGSWYSKVWTNIMRTTGMGHTSKHLLQSATKIAALPSWASCGCYLFKLYVQIKIKNQDFCKCFHSWRDKLQCCAQHWALKWLFREYLVNSGFMGVPVLVNA